MLFVDNPVGTGFSYTDRPDGYATNVATVASDMLVLLQHFFSERAEFQVCQLYALDNVVVFTEACYCIYCNSTVKQEWQKHVGSGLNF